MALSVGCADTDRKDLAQAAASDRELGGLLGQGDREKGPEEKMKPSDFLTGRAL